MGKWMSAAVVVAMMSCGPGGELIAPPAQEAAQVGPDTQPEQAELQAPAVTPATGLTPLPQPQGVPKQVVQVDVGLEVLVKGLLAAEGQQVSVVVGQFGCGFWVQAHGKATVVNGLARVTLAGLPSDTQGQLMVSFDTDGDGQCSNTDTVWSQPLVVGHANSSLEVDLAAMESSQTWLCFAFGP